jgi:hypothetical protein
MVEPTIGNVLLIVGLAIVGFGIMFAVLVVDQRRRTRRAVPARGVVVSIRSDEGRLEPTVRFRTADGAEVIATCSQGRRTWRPDYRPGQPVALRYDPRKPSWVLVEGHSPETAAYVVASVVALVIGAGLLALRGALA